jgi:hypothetical protein
MHVMIDIETLGTTNDSVILQIGAVGFATNGIDLDGFFADVSVKEQITIGRKVSEDTLAWWLDGVPSNARHAVFTRNDSDMLSFSEALIQLNKYIVKCLNEDTKNNTPYDRVWANSPTFDLGILRNAMKTCAITPAWKYWQEADVRTIKVVDDIINGTEHKTTPKMMEGIDHSALDDAKNQAMFVSNFLQYAQFLKDTRNV